VSDSVQSPIKNLFAEAELYYTQGLVDEATELYREVLHLIGNKTAHPLYQEAKKRLAESISSDESSDNPFKPKALTIEEKLENKFHNSVGLMDAGFPKEAIAELEKLLAENYNPAAVHAKLGECYQRINQSFDAIDSFEEALKYKLPVEERLDVLYKIALLHEKTGNVPKAIEALKHIVRLDKSFRNAAQRLEDLSKSAKKFGRFYYLIHNGIIDESQLDRAREISKESRTPIETILINQFGVEKEEIGKSLSEYYKCPFIVFDELEVGNAPACVKGVKEHFFRTNVCVPIKEEKGVLLVALDNPYDISKTDAIKTVLKASKYEFAVGLKEDIDKYIDYFFGKYNLIEEDEDLFEQLDLEDEEFSFEEDAEDELVSDSDNVVVQMVNKIIDDAYVRNASDIHIESLTGKRGTKIRYRIDGDCLQYQTIPFNYKKALVSRIKIMSNLDIAEKRLPQDGKIKFRTRQGKNIELRVATLPTTEGNEDIVLRILASSEAMPLDKMGLTESNLKKVKNILEMPYGLILVVGPTGSGKTTTLHAALGYINRPDKKIWTAEDPVEIMQDGLRQVQVRPMIDLTFARVLRAFLRADPDVIMVGETRDEETAHTVIEASLTGHLVFSTLHTNSAPETITRLLGIGMDPFNFADALLGVLAQRLVKRLCPKCKEEFIPDDEEVDRIIREFGEHYQKTLTREDFENATMFKAKGCAACNNTGYKGRMAIHELIISTDALRKLIQDNRPVMEIREQAMKDGMFTLKQDGIMKVLSGDTDMKQVRAVCIK
jgi:type II secretory ATPase GspE/PulE/Tfp pilus assembly ATPase PilB-like protein